MNRFASLRAVAVLTLLAATATAARGQTLIDLGTLSGGSNGSSYGFAINELGDVAGQSTCGDSDHGFVRIGSTMYDLENLQPYPYHVPSAAYGINDDGEIVGWSMSDWYPGEDYAVVHMQDDWDMLNIGELLGVYQSFTYAVNQGGVSCGEAAIWEVAGQEAFYYNGSVYRMGFLSGGGMSCATAINNASPYEIAGYGTVTGNQTRAFRWSNGTYTNLGTRLGGNHSMGFGINDDGLVAGKVEASSGPDHAFIFPGTSGGTDLGTYSSTIGARANDINNLDEVVGRSTSSVNGYTRALYWTSGGSLVDLTATYGTGWTALVDAAAINDDGQIVGTGVKNGKFRAYLLNLP